MKMKTPLIDGALSQIGSEFVSEKQKLGYSYSSNAYIVRDFSRFIETQRTSLLRFLSFSLHKNLQTITKIMSSLT